MNILALDIGGTAIKSGLFQNDILSHKKETPTCGTDGIDSVVDTICSIIAEYKTHASFAGVGISMTGQISPEDGHIIFATDSIAGAIGYPFQKAIADRCGLPVTVDNDVNCAAIGEAYFGSAKEFKNFLCLTYGTGIGGAIVIDKKIFYGKIGVAGEFGHMITHADGRSCVCGKKGCYEMYGSANALIRHVQAKTGEALNGREIFDRFSDPVIRSCIDSWIDEIVYGLVSLLHIFNPEAVILGGGILEQTYVYEEIVRRTRKSVIESCRSSQLIRASLGNMAGIYGAFQNARTRFHDHIT